MKDLGRKANVHRPLRTNPKLFPSLCRSTSTVLVSTPDGFWTEVGEEVGGDHPGQTVVILTV